MEVWSSGVLTVVIYHITVDLFLLTSDNQKLSNYFFVCRNYIFLYAKTPKRVHILLLSVFWLGFWLNARNKVRGEH